MKRSLLEHSRFSDSGADEVVGGALLVPLSLGAIAEGGAAEGLGSEEILGGALDGGQGGPLCARESAVSLKDANSSTSFEHRNPKSTTASFFKARDLLL